MSRSKTLGPILGAAFFAAGACASVPAYALEAKQCLSMADMNAALRAEGQRTLIIGDRMAINDDASRSSGVRVTRYVNTVTSNMDGSVGYQLEGDLPRSQSSTTVCVAAKLTNVRLFDDRKATIPAAAYLGGQFDTVVRDLAALGTRPMAVADTIHPDGHGRYRTGLPVVMFGNPEGRSGSIQTKLVDGTPQFLVGMSDTDYTAAGLERLNPQVAIATP